MLSDFVRVSGAPCLRHLEVDHTAGTCIGFLDILRAAPELRSIKSSEGPVEATVLQALAWHDRNPERQLVPKLDSLSLELTDENKDDMFKLLRSRAHMWKNVVLKIRDSESVRLEDEILALNIPAVRFHG